ncbi:MAG: CsgG/HfaB family protein [Candidatus Oleimicrobiaceae bacterium]
MPRNGILAAVVVGSCAVVGCAASHYTRAKSELRRHNYEAAVQYLTLALEERRGDPRVLRDAGIALYGKKDYAAAIPVLQKAFMLDSTDAHTLFYLGSAYEFTGDLAGAIEMYRRYNRVGRRSEMRRALEGRLQVLLRRRLAEEARAALAFEASLDTVRIPENAVAVLNFARLGGPEELAPLEKGLAEMLITDLSKVKALRVVERARMQALLEEMGLGMTGLVAEATAPRLGRLLGVAKVVQGGFVGLEGQQLRIEAAVVDTKSRRLHAPRRLSGGLQDFFGMEKALTFRILAQMGIPLSQAERDAILLVPTENVLAFLAYCRGLDYEDRGMFADARAAYQHAAQLDPRFKAARAAVSHVEQMQVGSQDMEALQKAVEPPAVTDALRPTPLDRLQRTEQQLSAGFTPGVDARQPLQEQSQSSFGSAASIEVVVPIPK